MEVRLYLGTMNHHMSPRLHAARSSHHNKRQPPVTVVKAYHDWMPTCKVNKRLIVLFMSEF